MKLTGPLRRFSAAFRSFAIEIGILRMVKNDGTVVSPDQHETAEEDDAPATVSYTGSLLSSSKELRKVLEVDV